jgi:arylsulfatase A-like enzyme
MHTHGSASKPKFSTEQTCPRFFRAGKWRGNKFTYYEGGLRVPAIISWPEKLPKNIKRDQLITAMDWLPTLRAMTDSKLPENLMLDGHDVSDIIRSADAPSKYDAVHWMFHNGWAVRKGAWKLLWKKELLNLDDPEPERKDYSMEKPELVRELTAIHDQWVSEVSPKTAHH